MNRVHMFVHCGCCNSVFPVVRNCINQRIELGGVNSKPSSLDETQVAEARVMLEDWQRRGGKVKYVSIVEVGTYSLDNYII